MSAAHRRIATVMALLALLAHACGGGRTASSPSGASSEPTLAASVDSPGLALLERVRTAGIADLSLEVWSEDPPIVRSAPIDPWKAARAWRKLHAQREPLGAAPVVVAQPAALARLEERALPEDGDASTLVQRWLDERQAAWTAFLPRCRESGIPADQCTERSPTHVELAAMEQLAALPSAPPQTALHYPQKPAMLGIEPDPVRLVVTTAPSYQLAALVGFGGWNEAPPPDAHAVMLRHWQETYGAELAYIGRDTLELIVARPPEDDASARALAREQLAYCKDTVFQGWQSAALLAASLRGSRYWFFWWD